MSQKKDDRIWVPGMDTEFSGETMSSKSFRDKISNTPSVAVLPDVWMIKVGGQSMMDRGREAVFPVLDELLKAQAEGIKFILGVGGGTRARHVYAQAMELNLPTGMLAKLGAGVPLTNARMLQMLLAKDGGIMCYDDDFEKLPLYLRMNNIPIMSGMPPYEFWEKSAAVGRIPQNRTDAGVYLLAEFFGSRGVLYIKDEDGMYTDDPKKNPDATFVPEAYAEDLLASDQDDMIVERAVLEYMTRAQHAKEIRIVNGCKPGNILAALRGENIGTVIRTRRS